jgi:hypothetical protein
MCGIVGTIGLRDATPIVLPPDCPYKNTGGNPIWRGYFIQAGRFPDLA